jgi:plastocyanin
MRKILAAIGMVSVLVAAALFVARPQPATAQAGGTVEVDVKYNGAPVVEKIKVNKDTQKCGTEAVTEKVKVGSNKGLANAVASVSDVKSGGKLAKAVLDQNGCKFVPHVLVMNPGEIDVKNSDDILHNIHTYSTANPSINKAQPKFKKVMMEKLEKPEIVKVTCDVHSWMNGWVAVTPGPAAVTDDNGVAKIENVPAGKHKIEVWHETLGKMEKDVDVKAGATTKVSFEMKGK